MEKLMAIFDGFDIEKLGEMLPSADALLGKMDLWLVLLVLAGPMLMLGFGLYYLFFAPEEANHSVGYRFFYAMSQVRVWQFAQRLAGLAYSGLGAVLFLIIGLISLRFAKLAPPDAVWLAAKCLLWEIILVVLATLVVDIIIVLLFDIKGEPRKKGMKQPAFLSKKTPPQRTRRPADTAQRTAAPRTQPAQRPAAQQPRSQTAPRKPQAQSAPKKAAPQNKTAPRQGQGQNRTAPKQGQTAARKPQPQRSSQQTTKK